MAIKKSKIEIDSKRVITTDKIDLDFSENSLRPKSLGDYVGQENIKKHLQVSISRSKKRCKPLEHILFYGPPGLGKTTISNIIAYEMGANLKITSGPSIEKQSDLVSILSNLEENDILFIDEIHRLKPQIEEILYTAMEDFVIDIMVGKGTGAQSVRLPVKSFTLIGATTKLSFISNPLRDRFGNVLKLDFYEVGDIKKIVSKNASNLGIFLEQSIVNQISFRSRGTPRIANRLLKIIRDYFVIGKDVNDEKVFSEIFLDLGVDFLGLDYLDRKYIENIYYKFASGPVGLSTIASSIGEEEATIEEVVEPYLIQIGFIQKTSRGRILTQSGIEHIKK